MATDPFFQNGTKISHPNLSPEDPFSPSFESRSDSEMPPGEVENCLVSDSFGVKMAGLRPELVPIDQVFRNANRVSLSELMLAVGHCSVLLLFLPILGNGTLFIGLMLVAGIYHSHIRMHIIRSMHRPAVSVWAKVFWPWLFVLKLILVAAISLFVFAVSAIAVYSLFYVGFRISEDHSIASEMAGWWGFFPAFISACLGGIWFFCHLAKVVLDPFPRFELPSSN